MGSKARIGVGIFVALLAGLCFWATERWLATRVFHPVQLPILLNTGRFETEFSINLRDDYSMGIELDESSDDWWPEDPSKCNEFRLQRVNWKIFRLSGSRGEKEREWAAPDPSVSWRIFWGRFYAAPGRYRILLEIPESTACLNARHPRLSVWTDRTPYDEICGWIELFCFLIGSSGVMLAVRGGWHWFVGSFRKDASLRMFPEIAMRNVLPMVRHRPMAMISGFTNLTVTWLGVLCALVVIFYWMLTQPLHQYGFAVDFKSPRGASVEHSPWTETMSVYIDGRGRFLVNGKIVDRELLESRLREEFNTRLVWTAYVEADLGSSFQDTLFAMDTIEGLGGKVIWITPKTRREWEESRGKPLVREYYLDRPHSWRRLQ